MMSEASKTDAAEASASNPPGGGGGGEMVPASPMQQAQFVFQQPMMQSQTPQPQQQQQAQQQQQQQHPATPGPPPGTPNPVSSPMAAMNTMAINQNMGGMNQMNAMNPMMNGMANMTGIAASGFQQQMSLAPQQGHPGLAQNVQVIQQQLQGGGYYQPVYNAQGQQFLMSSNIALPSNALQSQFGQQIQVITANKPFQQAPVASHVLAPGKQLISGQTLDSNVLAQLFNSARNAGYTAMPTSNNQTLLIMNQAGLISAAQHQANTVVKPADMNKQQQQQPQQQHQQQQQPYVQVVNGVPPKSPGMSLTGGNVKNVQGSVASQATALVSQSQMITSQAPSGAAMIPGQTQIISPFQCVPMTQQFVPQGLTWAATGLQQQALFGPNQIVIRGPQPEMIFQAAPQQTIAQHAVAPAPVPNQVVKARPSADPNNSTLQPKAAAPRQLSTILPMSTSATTPTPIRPASSVSTQTSVGTQSTPASTPRAPGKGRKAAVSRPGQAGAAKNDASQVRMAAPMPVVPSHVLQAIPHQQLGQPIITQQPGQLQFQIQQPIQVQQFPAQALQQHPQLVHLQQQQQPQQHQQQQPQQHQQQQQQHQGDLSQIGQIQEQQQQMQQHQQQQQQHQQQLQQQQQQQQQHQQQHQQQMQQLQQHQQQQHQQQQLQPPKLTPMQAIPVSTSIASTPASSPASSAMAPQQHLAAPQQPQQPATATTPLPPQLTPMPAPPAGQMPPLQQVVLQQQPIRSSYKPIAPAPPPASSSSSSSGVSEPAIASQPMQHGPTPVSSSGIVTIAGLNSVNGGILTMSSAPLSAMVNMTNAVQPSVAAEPAEAPVPPPATTFMASAPVVACVPATSEAQTTEFPQVPSESKPEQPDVSSTLTLSVPQTPEPMDTGAEAISHQVNGVSPSVARDRKDMSPPRAVVRPQILTHVLGDFVIQESAEPFPIGRFYTNEITTNGHDRVPGGQAAGEPPRKTPRVETVMGTVQIPPHIGTPKNVPVATCESCGKMDLASRFRRSKRFCTAACAKRFAQQHGKEASTAPGTPQQHSPGKIPVEKPFVSPIPDLSKAPLVIPAAVAPVTTDSADKEDSTLDAELLALAAEQMKSPVLNSNHPQTPTQQAKQQEKVNPAKWTVNEVVDFVRSLPGCADYAEDFALQEIDGQALMLLKADHLMTAMNMKLGPAVKICAKIDAMKADLNSSSNNSTGNNKQTP